MRYIFLSPHLDDISFSCGGIVDYFSHEKIHVEIWSFFAGIPTTKEFTPFAQSLHDRWKLSENAPAARREEDIAACKILGANYKHFDYLDCIYRFDDKGKPIINKEEDLYQEIPSSQLSLVDEISDLIQSIISNQDIIIAPLTIGNHIDHRIINQSVKNLSNNNRLFYEDFPYVIKSEENEYYYQNLKELMFNLSHENIKKWYESIAAYKSQISTFWKSISRMKSEIQEFYAKGGGKCLWKE